MFVFVILILAAVLILSRALNQDPTTKQEAKPKKVDSWKGAFAAYGLAWSSLKKNPLPALVVTVIYVLAIVASSLVQDKGLMQPGHISYEVIASLLFLVAMPKYSLSIADQRKASIKELIKTSPKMYLMVLATTILTILIMFLSIIPLAIPFIWTYAWYFASVLAAVDKGKSPFNALQYSKDLAENHKGKVWGLYGAYILISVATAPLMFIPVIGVYLFQMSVFMISIWVGASSAILYRWLQSEAK